MYDEKFLIEKTEAAETHVRKNNKDWRIKMAKAIGSELKGVKDEFMFAFYFARSQYLWGQLTQIGSDNSLLSDIVQNFPNVKKIPLIGRLVSRAVEKRSEKAKNAEEWTDALKSKNPLYKYKLDNPKVLRAFGKDFDTFFCNSVLAYYDRWVKDLGEFESADGQNYFLNDFYAILSMLLSEEQMAKVLNRDLRAYPAMVKNVRWITSPLSLFVGPVLKHPDLAPHLYGHHVLPRIIKEYPVSGTKGEVSLSSLEEKTALFSALFSVEDDDYRYKEQLAKLTPDMLFKLYQINNQNLRENILHYLISRLVEGEDQAVVLIEFFACADETQMQGMFDLLYRYRTSNNPCYQVFLAHLRTLASQDGFVDKYNGFLSKVFSYKENILIKAIIIGVSGNFEEFTKLFARPYCNISHLKECITKPEVLAACAKHKVVLEEVMFVNIIEAMANGELMSVVADETISIYVTTIRAYVNKMLGVVSNENARNLLVPLFSHDATRKQFFPNLTRASFIKLLNACTLQENAARLSQTFFREINGVEGGHHPTLSSVLQVCVREITNPEFYRALFQHQEHCDVAFKVVTKQQFEWLFNHSSFAGEEFREALLPYAKKLYGDYVRLEEVLPEAFGSRYEYEY